ncbi:MAG: hypothetical protein CW691_06345 [Candidatus Bathyarchaeum sp.]|nr:MAG: hypothetical protein CW691_06345 [Candidatus Bathyarchaeum sp.]
MLAVSVATIIWDTLSLPSELDAIIFSIISFALIFAVMSVVFYLAGNVVIGRKRVSLKDAFSISVLGTLVLIVCLPVFSLEITLLLSLVAWLLLVRYYYETGLAGAIAIGVTSVFVSLVILTVLSFILDFPLLFDWLSVFVMS